MGEYISQIFSSIVLVLLGAINTLLIWALHRQWWKIRGVRLATWIVPLVGIGSALFWAIGRMIDFFPIERLFAFLTAFFFLSFLILTILLPFSGVTLSIERSVRSLWKKKGATKNGEIEAEAPVDQQRRSIITTGAAAFPMLAIGTGTLGLVRSSASPVFPNIEMAFDNLHPDLDGLCLLHISDLHLGYYIRLEHVEEILIGAEALCPDLVLITGDISDDLSLLPDALQMISELRPRYGTFASLGNHEYYRGIGDVLRIFDKGPIPLLVEKNATLKVNNTDLIITGADDPVGGNAEGSGKRQFLRESIEQGLDGAPSNAFHLLMTHRPEGFDPASALGLEMTIAGHTHAGGQIGWNGRSFFETWLGIGKYLWGYYEKNGGNSKLYTTAGAGHWLPFRLGVPREVPIYTLRRGGVSDRLA